MEIQKKIIKNTTTFGVGHGARQEEKKKKNKTPTATAAVVRAQYSGDGQEKKKVSTPYIEAMTLVAEPQPACTESAADTAATAVTTTTTDGTAVRAAPEAWTSAPTPISTPTAARPYTGEEVDEKAAEAATTTATATATATAATPAAAASRDRAISLWGAVWPPKTYAYRCQVEAGCHPVHTKRQAPEASCHTHKAPNLRDATHDNSARAVADEANQDRHERDTKGSGGPSGACYEGVGECWVRCPADRNISRCTVPPDVTFDGDCYLCGKSGHSQNYCFLRKCHRCGRYGHSERVCLDAQPSRALVQHSDAGVGIGADAQRVAENTRSAPYARSPALALSPGGGRATPLLPSSAIYSSSWPSASSESSMPSCFYSLYRQPASRALPLPQQPYDHHSHTHREQHQPRSCSDGPAGLRATCGTATAGGASSPTTHPPCAVAAVRVPPTRAKAPRPRCCTTTTRHPCT